MRVQPLRVVAPGVVEDRAAGDLHLVHGRAPAPVGLVVGGQQRRQLLVCGRRAQDLLVRPHPAEGPRVVRAVVLLRVVGDLEHRAPLLQLLGQRVRQDRPRVKGRDLRLTAHDHRLAEAHAQPRPVLADLHVDARKVHPLQHRPVQGRKARGPGLVLAPPGQEHSLRHHLHRVGQLLPVGRVEHWGARARPPARVRPAQRLLEEQLLVARILLAQRAAVLPELAVQADEFVPLLLRVQIARSPPFSS